MRLSFDRAWFSPKALVRRLLAPPAFEELEVVRRALPPGHGTLIDVGAHLGSSMRQFIRDGWRVYAFEPDPATRSRLMSDPVTQSGRVVVDARAVAEHDGDLMPLYTSPESTGISTLAPFRASHSATATVTTVRLDTFLAELRVDKVTVLKTDTEGYDLPVLRTFPWHRLRPSCVVTEFEDRKTRPLGYDWKDIVAFLKEHGYVVFISEWYPVIEYGGPRHRWRSLRLADTGLVDPGAWGNIIAIEPRLTDALLRSSRSTRIRREIGLVRLRRWLRATIERMLSRARRS